MQKVRLCRVEPEPLANKVKRPAARKRRRCQDARLDFFEELATKQFRNIDRRRTEKDPFPATLEPVNIIVLGLMNDKIEIRSRLFRAANQTLSFRYRVRERIDRCDQPSKRGVESFVRFTKRCRSVVAVTSPK